MDEQLTPTTARSTGEKVIIGALVFLGVAVMVGIQSLFLTHVAAALPADSTWRYITILCFMAPPFMVGALMIFKLNYSRSSAQDWILTLGMGIELLFFAINVIVAVNASAIEDTLIGFVGLILGGLAGLVSVGTVAFALSADPVRAVHKQSIINHLDTISALHTQNRKNLAAAMQSDRVRARTENAAEIFVMNMMGQLLGQQLTGDADRREVKQVASIAPTPQPARVLNDAAPTVNFDTAHTATTQNTRSNDPLSDLTPEERELLAAIIAKTRGTDPKA